MPKLALKRRGHSDIAGIYFRISDDEPVWVAHYGQAHRKMTAAEGSADFLASENREGWEVNVRRRVASREVRRSGSLVRVVGWWCFPGAKGKAPFRYRAGT